MKRISCFHFSSRDFFYVITLVVLLHPYSVFNNHSARNAYSNRDDNRGQTISFPPQRRVKNITRKIFKILDGYLNRIKSIGYLKSLSSFVIQVIKGAMFEFITRRIARKAVDWHHSELDEIITGAICARHGREKAASLTYKTRGSWKSKKKKKEDDLERRYRVTILQARESFQLTYAMKLRNERQNDRALLRDVL